MHSFICLGIIFGILLVATFFTISVIESWAQTKKPIPQKATVPLRPVKNRRIRRLVKNRKNKEKDV